MVKYFNFSALLTFILLSSTSVEAQTSSGKFTNLGPQVFASVIQGSVFADDKEGNSYAYTVVRGRPAHLIGYRLNPLTRVLDVELPGTDGSWDVEVSSNGIVYVAAANGDLYHHIPGTTTVTNLGKVLPGEKVIWDLTAGKDGEIFGGTYPGAKVFRYHPEDGFSDVGNGPLIKDENYVRSVIYHHKTGKVYAGVASHSALVELDPETGDKKQLLADEDRDQEAIYHINLVEGVRGGDRVFGWLTGPAERVTVVYNLKTRRFEENMPTIDVKSVIKSLTGSKVYYTAGRKLFVVDYKRKKNQPKELADLEGETKTIRWGKDKLLYILTADKYIHTYNTKTSELTTEKLDVPGQPVDIQSIVYGPDGNIWSAGYLVGGNATYNPSTGENTQRPGLDQTEGFGQLGSTLYFGIYPKARLHAYDTREAWDLKTDNPKFLGQIKGQDRPFAVLGIEKLNKVLFGTVPGYGKLGGALIEYDLSGDTLETFDNIIPNQSITSLVESGDVIIGGTSIFGGLGGKPIEKEAKIFGWDPIQQKKTFEMVPVAGAMAITGLTNMPDGKIWGFADGDLIVFDATKRSVASKHAFFKINQMPSHIWRSAFIVLHPSGDVYVAVRNTLYKVNPETMVVTKIEDNVGLLTMDEEGTLYFRRNTDLWSYKPH